MSDHSGGSDSGDDENEIVAIKKLKLVHFGSQAEAVKILNRNENEKGTAAGSKVGVDFSNISTSNGMTSAILNYLYLLVCFCKVCYCTYFFQSIWSSTSKLMQQKRKCWQNLKEGEKY